MMGTIYNFSAGPAMLPKAVLEKAQLELTNFHGLGTSVMEISHRSKAFLEIAAQAQSNLRQLLSIPENYHVLYAQGGARGQFAAVPMNLLGSATIADYVNTGYWSASAATEAKKYCTPHIVSVLTEKENKRSVLAAKDWKLSDDAAFVHLCPNETIEGIRFNDLPKTKKPIVADMSSCILSKPIDVSQYGVIYAGAQKNIGPAGLTLLIVRDDLLGRAKDFLPSILNYKTLSQTDSMFNTPPTFSWYLAGEVYKWLLNEGGLEAIEKKNEAKAALLYEFIDGSDFYHNHVHPQNRSIMNVTFQLKNPALDETFLAQTDQRGLKALKGHRDVGGMRASIYNAMPLDGVKALLEFMKEFEQKNTHI